MIYFFRNSGNTAIHCSLLLILVLMLFLPAIVFSSGEHTAKGESHHSKKGKAEFLKQGERAPGFELTSQDEAKISLNDFLGTPVFITFIYTSCKTSCSLILQNIDFIKEKVTTDSKLTFLAITVDPAIDTTSVLKEYLNNTGLSGSNLTLLTGGIEEVKKVLRGYKVKIARIAETGEVLGHPNVGYLIDVNGLVRDVIVFKI